MRRLLLLALAALLATALISPAPALAQGVAPQGQRAEDATTLSFAELGASEQSLRGPADAAYLDFSLPATWELRQGAELRLDLQAFFAGEAERAFGGTLRVMLNGATLATLLLDTPGSRSLSVSIEREVFTALRPDGRHRLALLLDTDEACATDSYTNLIIRPSSAFVLPHQIVAPPTDLTRLPYPIVQRSLLGDAATIVVPDAPSAAELQAALTVAAGFGRMSGDALALSLTPAGQLSEAARDETHLIVVGRAANLGLLREVELPAPRQGERFAAPGALPDDGVVQLAVSPWNASKVVLVAGGDSDAAVVKAAQAVSSGALRTGARPDLALVAGVAAPPAAETVSLDQTFADLGYASQRMAGLGGQYAGYSFDIPPGLAIEEEAYLDLAFVHTALLDYDQSAITVSLNDEPIASLRLDDNSTSLGGARVALPAGALRAGSNQLTIRADLLPRAVCADPRGNGLWLTIRPESLLHLPLAPAHTDQALPTADLSSYPLPFTATPNLSGVAFVLGAEDPAGWEAAAQVALDLGRQTQGSLMDLAAVYADAVPDTLRQERDLILVGRASALPLLAELGPALPAPFAPGSAVATEPGAAVTYRLDAGASVGYLQLLDAPWSNERSVLAVLGSTDDGLRWAQAALTTPRLRSMLRGNLAVIRGEQVESRDTRPAQAEPAVAEPEPAAEAAPAAPGTLMLLGVAGGGLLALAAVVGGIVWWLRRRAGRRLAAGASRSEPDDTTPDEKLAGTTD
jgi:hypothetical protein